MTTATGADIVEARFVRQEHRELRAGLAGIEETIEEAHRLTQHDLSARVHRILDWLRRELVQHADWEDRWLFPELDAVAGTPWATRLLRDQHDAIRSIIPLLEADAQALRTRWGTDLAFGVIARLARLDAILRMHVDEEERYGLPLLGDVEG